MRQSRHGTGMGTGSAFRNASRTGVGILVRRLQPYSYDVVLPPLAPIVESACSNPALAVTRRRWNCAVIGITSMPLHSVTLPTPFSPPFQVCSRYLYGLTKRTDDQTCRLWSDQGALIGTHQLSSAGVAVQFHSSFPQWLMVAESCGAIRVMDIERQEWLTSVWSPEPGLRHADWSFVDDKL